MSVPPLLEGVRVVDLSRVLAGPYAGQVLAEMGADVVKVESPNGDSARGIGPFAEGHSLYFAALNTGKRGVVLDLSSPTGQEGFGALLATADIVIENFRTDAARKLRCDPKALLSQNGRLVIVTISGYASVSELADEPAFDLTAQAESGIMSLTGYPGEPPARAGVPIGDLATGLWAALAAVGGYIRALRHKRGIHLEVPLIDTSVSLLSYVATAAAWNGADPPKVGSGHHSVVPYGAYPTLDGWIAVAVIGDKFWVRLCDALELDEFHERADFGTNRQRHLAQSTIDQAITARLARLTRKVALNKLATAGVPAAPINGVLEAISSQYVRERGLVAHAPYGGGTYSLVRGPLCSDSSVRPAPLLGEHTEEVMEEALGPDSPVLGRLMTT